MQAIVQFIGKQNDGTLSYDDLPSLGSKDMCPQPHPSTHPTPPVRCICKGLGGRLINIGKILVGSVRSHGSLRPHRSHRPRSCIMSLSVRSFGSLWYIGSLSIMGLGSQKSKPLFLPLNFSDKLRNDMYERKSQTSVVYVGLLICFGFPNQPGLPGASMPLDSEHPVFLKQKSALILQSHTRPVLP